MADIIGLAAGITALIEVSAKVTIRIRKLIHAIQNAPKELYLIHIEVFHLNGILDTLKCMHDANRIPRSSLDKLQGWNGLVSVCRRTLAELDRIIEACPQADVDAVGVQDPWVQRAFDQLVAAVQASKAKRLLEDVRRFTDSPTSSRLLFYKTFIQQAEILNAVERGVGHLRATFEVKELDDLLHWISSLNPSYRQSFFAARSLRYKGTCNWLLERQEYLNWRDLDQDINLCVSGPAGAGKTVLSAAILQDLMERSHRQNQTEPEHGDDVVPVCIIYYYFDLRDAFKNTTAGFYDSLVRQLLQYNPLGYSKVLELAKITHRAHPDPSEYIELIGDLLDDVLATSHVYFVIDGFDCEECNDYDNLLEAITSWKSGLQRLDAGGSQSGSGSPPPYNKGHLKILATCRTTNVPKVKGPLEGVMIPVLDDPIVKDICTYVRGLIHNIPPAAKTAIGEPLLEEMIRTIVRQSNNLFIQAKLHIDKITGLETVSEIEDALLAPPKDQSDTYASLLLNIIERHPDEHNGSVIQRMFLRLCQAKYCLSVSEFVAVTTLSITSDSLKDPNKRSIIEQSKKLMSWDLEAYCARRLGPFLNIDRRPSPPEINLPHVTMEEFLQGPAIGKITSLKPFQIVPADAQRKLAVFCIGLLGSGVYDELDVPLTEADHQSVSDTDHHDTVTSCGNNHGHDKGTNSGMNPFKIIPGGLSSLTTPLDPAKNKWIAPIRDRLAACPGLEYCSINWHHHLRNAFILTGKQEDWRAKRVEWLEETIVPMMREWFLNAGLRNSTADSEKDRLGHGNGRYKSWCETHAYFCHELEEDCQCGVWQEPRYFLKVFGFSFLLPYLDKSHMQNVEGRGESVKHAIKRRCSECEVPLAHEVVADDLEREKCPPCLSTSSTPFRQCGRSFKLFQRPELKWRALKDLRKYGLAQPV